MNTTWNLDVMYKGYDDPKYINDIKKVEETIKNIKNLVLDENNPVKTIEASLVLTEQLNTLLMELFTYSSLKSSTNVNDFEAMTEMGKLQIMLQETVESDVKFQTYLTKFDLDSLAKESEVIKIYLFLLKKQQEEATHMLSEKEEILASKLQMVGSNSWSDLQSQLTSNIMIKVEGFDEEMPLSAVRSLAYSANKEERINAYNAEINAYKQIDSAVAMALNNIKREVNIMMPLRGYEDALSKTLKQSNVSKETLNAMIEAIKDERENFRRYFKLKAKALGYKKGLPFYEIFAPMGSMTRTYSIDEAKDLILDVYKSFSNELYEMGKTAFENRWIDFLPKEGKVGGAFCASLDNHHESRVLTNFTGSLGDVQTLAHELGHAYHGHVIHNNAPLNRDYPMPLAETASILCQTLMAKKMINDITDPNELLTVVEQSLQEDTQCVIDILSRFIFESDVLSKPISQPLSSNDLCEMMLNAQDESYGDGLDKDYRHPYMWLCKSHYYSAGLNFYNWPYAFGLLYAKGLYKEYLKDKEQFVKNYDQMLMNTGCMSVEDVAKSMNIDVTKKDFWIESLKFIEEDIELFEELLKKTKNI